jgi:hypothetical protein
MKVLINMLAIISGYSAIVDTSLQMKAANGTDHYDDTSSLRPLCEKIKLTIKNSRQQSIRASAFYCQ